MFISFDSSRRLFCALSALFLLAAVVSVARAQVTIHHVPPGCYPEEGHLLVSASVVASTDSTPLVRVYFRAAEEESFYFVEMKRRELDFSAVLPRPLETTKQVVYYIESWDPTDGIARSRVYGMRVADASAPCDPEAAQTVTDASPGLVVFYLAADAAPQPPGFSSDGVASYQQGQVLGRDSNSKLIVAGVVATGAALVSVAVLGTEGSVEDVPIEPPVVPPTQPPIEPPIQPPVGSEPVIACFDAPVTAAVGERVRLDASCSNPRDELEYAWELGDRRTRDGRVVNPIYRSPGEYTVGLTVKRGGSDSLLDQDQMTRQIQIVAASAPSPSPGAPGTAGADLAVSISGVLTGRIFVWGITYVINVSNFGPSDATGVTLVDAVPASLIINGLSGAFCSGAPTLTCDLGTLPAGSTKTITLDVTVGPTVGLGDTVVNVVTVNGSEPDPRPGTNRAESRVQIAHILKTDEQGSAIDTSVMSSLEGFAGVVQGSVLFNQSAGAAVTSSTPVRHQIRGSVGPNVIEASLSSPAEGDGVWRFDFNATAHFQPGSISVRQGRVLQQDANRIAFRIGANPGERIEFTVQLTR